MHVTRDNNYWIVTNNVQSSPINSIKMNSLFSKFQKEENNPAGCAVLANAKQTVCHDQTEENNPAGCAVAPNAKQTVMSRPNRREQPSWLCSRSKR